MDINVKIIPHNEQRYRTCGDWWKDENGVLQIRVSELQDWKQESLIAVHELVEVLIAWSNGIKTEDVDDFDIKYEKERDEGLHKDYEEPGFDPKCPVVKEHTIATGIELILAKELGVDWSEYDKKVIEL